MNRNIITRKTALLSKQDLESVTGNEELSAEAKAIYLHLLAKTNNGGFCSPSLQQLSKELNMTKKRIISHRKQLEELGLLKVIKGGGGKGAVNNAYHVVFEPLADNMNKYTKDGTKQQTDGKECEIQANSNEKLIEKLQELNGQIKDVVEKLEVKEEPKFTGITDKEYLLVVMCDEEITAEAKAIYAYLHANAFGGLVKHCTIRDLTKELKMTNKRILKHRKQLEEKGYIVVERTTDKDGARPNLYWLLGSERNKREV